MVCNCTIRTRTHTARQNTIQDTNVLGFSSLFDLFIFHDFIYRIMVFGLIYYFVHLIIYSKVFTNYFTWTDFIGIFCLTNPLTQISNITIIVDQNKLSVRFGIEIIWISTTKCFRQKVQNLSMNNRIKHKRKSKRKYFVFIISFNYTFICLICFILFSINYIVFCSLHIYNRKLK